MTTVRRIHLLIGLAVGALGLPTAAAGVGPSRNQEANVATQEATSDQEAILEHIHGLFRAYLRKDREAIRAGHTTDWRGFQVPSDQIVRGIDQYMTGADQILADMRGVRYELLDTDVHVHGDMAIVYYRASYWVRESDGKERLVPLRSVDVYRREPRGWNQCGSNISVVPELPADSRATSRILRDDERRRLLADREAVWRAYFAGDQAELERLLPEETIAVNAGDGPWQDRSAVLKTSAEFAAAGGTLTRLVFPRSEIQCYGSVAIIYTTYEVETETKGERHSMTGRGTEIFVDRDGRWRNAGWHLDSGR